MCSHVGAEKQAAGVDLIVAQWARERPELDVSPMQVFGPLARANRLMEQQLDTAVGRHGLDSGSFDVLATLLRSGPAYRPIGRRSCNGAR